MCQARDDISLFWKLAANFGAKWKYHFWFSSEWLPYLMKDGVRINFHRWNKQNEQIYAEGGDRHCDEKISRIPTSRGFTSLFVIFIHSFIQAGWLFHNFRLVCNCASFLLRLRRMSLGSFSTEQHFKHNIYEPRSSCFMQ